MDLSNIDLGSVWNLVMSSTQQANQSGAKNGSLSDAVISGIVKSVITNALTGSGNQASTNKNAASGLDFMAIANSLLGLYNQYKGSSDPTEKQAALNVKNISGVISAMANPDGAGLASAGASILGQLVKNGKVEQKPKEEEKGSGLSIDTVLKGISVLGGLFGKK